MNLLFPVSVTRRRPWSPALLVQDAPRRRGRRLRGDGLHLPRRALTALAVLEHWFLVLPLPDAALWGWALRLARRPTADRSTASAPPIGLAPTLVTTP